MKKKIFLTLLLCFVMLFALSVSVLALTVPSEYQDTQYGANYDTSHEEGCCTPEGSGETNHYDDGYQDGFLDGWNSGLASTEITDDEKQQIINDYLASPEYKQLFEAAKQQAIEDYKNSNNFASEILNAYNNGYTTGVGEYKGSTEYNTALETQYANGVSFGYEQAYNQAYSDASDAMYDKGIADGYAQFRSTSEYKNTLQANYDGGYMQGYTDGHADALVVTEDDSVKPSNIITLVLTLVGVCVLLFLLLSRKKKKR